MGSVGAAGIGTGTALASVPAIAARRLNLVRLSVALDMANLHVQGQSRSRVASAWSARCRNDMNAMGLAATKRLSFYVYINHAPVKSKSGREEKARTPRDRSRSPALLSASGRHDRGDRRLGHIATRPPDALGSAAAVYRSGNEGAWGVGAEEKVIPMTRNSDNRRRAFADVVAIDAWHANFDGTSSHADLHADVVFGTARVGGESDSPVRFRLSVKRAEIVIVIPESEPVSVDTKSVSRDAPDQQGRLTEIVERTTEAHGKGTASASVGLTKFETSASAEAAIRGSLSTSQRSEISATIQFMDVTSSKTEDGHYRWIVQPNTKETLQGRPWNAAKQPRLTLVDRRKDRTKGIPPTVRVEVRCRREDLVIDDLEIKDEGIWDAAKRSVGFKNKLAAAASYIRDRLVAEGLEVSNIEDIFGRVTLGSTTAEAV